MDFDRTSIDYDQISMLVGITLALGNWIYKWRSLGVNGGHWPGKNENGHDYQSEDYLFHVLL